MTARLRTGDIRPGVVFLPFHYGYWDTAVGDRPAGKDGTAANELTPTEWDPVSIQPLFKSGAAAMELVRSGRRSERTTTPAVEPERSAR